jgi:hypothetical protein
VVEWRYFDWFIRKKLRRLPINPIVAKIGGRRETMRKFNIARISKKNASFCSPGIIIVAFIIFSGILSRSLQVYEVDKRLTISNNRFGPRSTSVAKQMLQFH